MIYESLEMIAQLWLCSMFFLTIIVPMRWLASHTFKLAHCRREVNGKSHWLSLQCICCNSGWWLIDPWLWLHDGNMCCFSERVARPQHLHDLVLQGEGMQLHWIIKQGSVCPLSWQMNGNVVLSDRKAGYANRWFMLDTGSWVSNLFDPWPGESKASKFQLPLSKVR